MAEAGAARRDEALTVVIVALVGGEALARCRAALAGETVLVVGRAAGAEARQPPGVEAVPALRMWALRAATTRYVALVEDTAVPPPGWGKAAMRALGEGAAAAGGPVQVSPTLAPPYQALALTEYAAFRQGAAEDEAQALPGLGFAVDRDAVLGLDLDDSGLLFEGEVFAKLRAAGRRLAYRPELALTYAAAYPEGARLSTRLLHGRLYASGRVRGRGAAVRAAYAAAAIALPILLTFRTLSSAVAAGPAVAAWVAAMQTAWAVGEFVGYATGRAGSALASWR